MEQVAELIKKSQAGDRQARDKLIADNLGLYTVWWRVLPEEGMTGKNWCRSEVSA